MLNGNIKKARDVRKALEIIDSIDGEYNKAVGIVDALELKLTNVTALVSGNQFINSVADLEDDLAILSAKVTAAKTALAP